MKQDKLSRTNIILYACGLIPLIWLALLTAPYLHDGLPTFLKNVGEAFSTPLHIELCEDSVKTVLIFLLIYALGLCIYISSDRNYRRREEHGSAKWGKPSIINRKYANPNRTENKLLTQNVGIGLDGRKHRRNLNVLCCGGSGSGKTRFFAKPNVMPLRSDAQDEYRRECNEVIVGGTAGANGYRQEKYLTYSAAKKDIEEARSYFARIGSDLAAHFTVLDSKCVELTAVDRLRILHVGIVAGFDENGDILIIHCASGYNNVVITGIEGFSSIGAPDYFGVAR